jgi:hypothetical protein
MSESNELRTMRMMAWERVKGELRSMWSPIGTIMNSTH